MSDTAEMAAVAEVKPRRIRPEIVTDALAKKESLTKQLQAAHAKQVQALADATAAERAVDDAIVRAAQNGTEPNPAIMLPLQQAQANVELQRRMVLQLEAMLEGAAAGIKAAQHEAHVGMYAQGVEMRIAAAAQIENGRLMLQAGHRAHKAATAHILDAARRGVQHPQFNGAGGLSITMPEPLAETTTEAGEREFWAARNAADGEWPHTPEGDLVRVEHAGAAPVAK